MTSKERSTLELILKSTLSACEKSINNANYDKDDRCQFTVALLLLRLYEQTYSVLTLSLSGLDSSIPIFFRVILEASIDFICLTKDSEFLNVILKEYVAQESKILNI
ncbi:DUF5677 domain-containing protein [Leptospira borgpetersenii]|uniref:DUF5677 domain-containing protein n=1 Tax=Leptospira borgpetersenii TaxID=174 RepID=UPI0005199D7A|nr:DUF5677 domain-containing protein [Leptospira borgpetersenii]